MEKPATGTTERVWLTIRDSAAYTGLHRVTLYRAVKRGELRAGGTGRAVRFERAELDRWMRSGGMDEK